MFNLDLIHKHVLELLSGTSLDVPRKMLQNVSIHKHLLTVVSIGQQLTTFVSI
jgi:hypothetical protein